MAQATENSTKNHQEIKDWVNAHNGTPALLGAASTGVPGSPITIWFREQERDVPQSFMAIDWAEFFQKFDEQGKTFTYGTDEDNNAYCMIQ